MHIMISQYIPFNEMILFNFIGADNTQDENIKGNMAKSTQFVEGNGESIGIGFFASGLVILIIGLMTRMKILRFCFQFLFSSQVK